jgi:hypothetical protein
MKGQDHRKMTPKNRWPLAFLFASAGIGPACASATQGEAASHSRASISISVSVAPRFAAPAAEPALAGAKSSGPSVLRLQCLDSNLPAGFTILAQRADGAIEERAPGKTAQSGASEVGRIRCRGSEGPLAMAAKGSDTATAADEEQGSGLRTLLIHPE